MGREEEEVGKTSPTGVSEGCEASSTKMGRYGQADWIEGPENSFFYLYLYSTENMTYI